MIKRRYKNSWRNILIEM